LIDESGLLMAPLVRRTWAPRGKTPKLAQRSGKCEKVSGAAAVWLSPLRDRLGLFARTLVDCYFDNWSSAAFLEALLKELPGPVVVWQPATVRADADRLSEGRRQVSTTFAGVFAPAPLTAQLRSTTRARLFFTQWRVQDPPR